MAKPRALRGIAKHYQMFIDGEWVDSKTEETINVVNPATERMIASVPKASREQAKDALEAAEEAQPKWEDLAPLQRAAFLFKTAQLIWRDKERLARLLTSEQGKPLFEARGEIEGAASNFEYYAEFAKTPDRRGRIDYSLELSLRNGRAKACPCTDHRKYGCDETVEQYASQHDRDGEADGGGRLSKRSCECCYWERIRGWR